MKSRGKRVNIPVTAVYVRVFISYETIVLYGLDFSDFTKDHKDKSGLLDEGYFLIQQTLTKYLRDIRIKYSDLTLYFVFIRTNINGAGGHVEYYNATVDEKTALKWIPACISTEK